MQDSENNNSGKPEAPARYKVYTLKEWGAKLPIGNVGPDGSIQRDFSHREFNFKAEKALEAMRKKKKGLSLGAWVNELMCYMTENTGGKSLDNKTDIEKTQTFSAMWSADVLYQYMYMRCEALGNTVWLQLICPYCKTGYKFAADLETMDVRVVEDHAHLTRTVELVKGIPYQGQRRKNVTIRALKWSAYENIDLSNQAMSKQSMLMNSVIGLDGVAPTEFSTIPGHAWDEVSKRDINILLTAIDDPPGGPIVSISATCVKCHQDSEHVIDWGYDHFFGHSSQSQNKQI